jgi:omega-hydroxy-beta-dihydromenaquinone-9 sulfotransferase
MKRSVNIIPAGFLTSAKSIYSHRQEIPFSCAPLIARVLVQGLVTSGLDRLQRMLHRMGDHELPAPVFVIGHWRSGTTLLHELLCMDTRYGYPNSYACMNPHHFLISGTGIRMMPSSQVQIQRPMDEMSIGLDSPQEDEFALLAMGAPSPYEAFMFPSSMMQSRRFLNISSLPKKEQEKWAHTFLRFLHMVSLENEGKPLILKSPTHTFRINMLLKIFPEAKFVHIVRNPYPVFASTLRMLNSMFSLYAITQVPGGMLEDYIIQNGLLMESCLDLSLGQLQKHAYVRVSHEDIIKEPQQQIRKIYETLELGDADSTLAAVGQYFELRKNYKVSSNPLLPEQKKLVCEKWGCVFKKYGYPV